MKKKVLASLLGVALLSSASAYAESMYLSVGAGRSEYKAEGESENETAASLAFGQSLGENWGYEIGYLNFGSLTLSDAALGSSNLRLRAQSVYAAAVGTLPVSESFSLFAKAGISANYVKASLTDDTGYRVSDSETKFGPVLGLGLAVNFTKEIAGTVEYRYFDEIADGGLKASALTASIRYHF